jgi:hypothetical protein
MVRAALLPINRFTVRHHGDGDLTFIITSVAVGSRILSSLSLTIICLLRGRTLPRD